jgi:hypothetical protein
MQRLTYVTLLVGLLMLAACAGLWWNLLKPEKALSRPGSAEAVSPRQVGR